MIIRLINGIFGSWFMDHGSRGPGRGPGAAAGGEAAANELGLKNDHEFLKNWIAFWS